MMTIGKWVAIVLLVFVTANAIGADRAPDWMQALKNVQLPDHRDKDDAICLYSENVLTVLPNGKMTTFVRKAYKILRVDSPHAVVEIPFDDQTKIDDLRGWTIPVSGKDFAVKDRDAVITGTSGGGVLISDGKFKVLSLPGAEPGALVGYEYEQEERPYFQEDTWMPQDEISVREASYTLQLPPGWSYKSVWRNGTAAEPISSGPNRWKWVVSNLKGIHKEYAMPPMNALALQLVIQLVPVAGQGKVLESWRDMGNWYIGLTEGRRAVTPAIKQQVAQLTANQSTLLGKIQTLAEFAQGDIRYVAILLGVGGVQPHAAGDILNNRFGDCKDKSTLLGAMLKEIGVDSYYILIHSDHDVVAPDASPSIGLFNHAIIAIRLPDSAKEQKLLSIMNHKMLGDLLIFDPTNEFIPFGQLPGYLQGNNALLVVQGGSELIKLPVQNASTNGVSRIAKLSLADNGLLSGEVVSSLVGYVSFDGRSNLQRLPSELDRRKAIESSLANSLSSFKLTDFRINNLTNIARPLEYQYSFSAEKYAKHSGDMLLVRSPVLDSKSSGLMETDEKRENPVEFVSLQKDTDDISVALPSGYVADELPEAVNIDYPFGSYHSKMEVKGNTLKYTRTFEIKSFTVPVDKVEDLKKFYRQIFHDERAMAVLRKVQ